MVKEAIETPRGDVRFSARGAEPLRYTRLCRRAADGAEVFDTAVLSPLRIARGHAMLKLPLSIKGSKCREGVRY